MIRRFAPLCLVMLLFLTGVAKAQEVDQEGKVAVVDTVTGPDVTYRIRLDQILKPRCKCWCTIRPDPEEDFEITVRVTLDGITEDSSCRAQNTKECETDEGTGKLEECGIKWEPTAAALFELEIVGEKIAPTDD